MVRLLIVAGEASGDLLAAELLAHLGRRDEDWTATGIGGPALRKAGMEVLVPAEELSVVGLQEVLGKLGVVRRALRRVRRALDAGVVDQVLLVDFPDFNLRVAAMAAARHVPVTYYVSPQVWAWRRGRLRVMARRVDQVLTLLPFEPACYRAEGIDVVHVGHPLVDRAAGARADLAARSQELVLLPGSRPGEVRALWPAFLDVAREVTARVPGVVVTAVRAPTLTVEHLPVPDDVPLRVLDGPATRALSRARCALVASGTATLESALCRTPHVVAYRVHPATWLLGRTLVRGVRHIALSNLVATGELDPERRSAPSSPVAPEHVQHLDPAAMAAPLVRWLSDDEAWTDAASRLDDVARRVGRPGAAARAADAVRSLARRPPRPVGAVGPREAWTLLAAVCLLVLARLLLATSQPLHPDEAYFWRWSLEPAWGYFDQPPMVAWMIAASRALLGDTVLAVRAPAALCSGAAAVLMYLTVREHATWGRATAATALLLTTPLVTIGSLLMTPDAPLTLWWTATLYAATRAGAPRWGRAPPADRWLAPWVWIGLLVGLGLLSKITMVLAPVGLALWWLLRRPRPLAGPAAALLVALLLVAPWIAWNASVGFAPFTWEMSHGLNPQRGSAWLRLLEYVGAQVGVVGPVLFAGAVWWWIRALGPRGTWHERLWALLSLPVLAAFGAASLLAPSNANWPAMAWPAAACGLAVSAPRRLLVAAVVTGGSLSVLLLVHMVVGLPAVPPGADPFADVVGYDALAEAVERELENMPDDTQVFASRYQDAAALSFAMGQPDRVHDRAGRGRPNQWDLWDPPPDEHALFVSLNPAADVSCEPLRSVEIALRGEVVRTYVLYPCAPPRSRGR